MRRVRRVLTALAALASGQAVAAAELPETLCKSAPNGLVSPLHLRSQALEGVSLTALDLNADAAVSADEVLQSLAQNTCGSPSSPVRCSKSDDRKLRSARNALDSILGGTAGLEISRKGVPTAADLQTQPLLAQPRAQLVDPTGRFYEIRCSTEAIAQAKRPKPKLTPVLVGKDLESLTAKRGDPGTVDRFKAVKQAEVGFTNDREKNIRTINVDGVAGYKFGTGTTAIIPFAQYVRAEIDDEANGTEKLTGKLALGGLVTFFVGKDQFDIAPYWTKDLEHRSKLLSARLAWRPGFLYDMPTFNNALHFACRRASSGACELNSGLALVTDAQLVAAAGSVLKEANDPTLTDGREFLRVGPSVTAQVYGLDGWFKNLSVDASYKRFFRLAGDSAKVYGFKAGINYWIAGSEHVSLRYGYEVGRDEDTLKKFDATKLGLGVRF